MPTDPDPDVEAADNGLLHRVLDNGLMQTFVAVVDRGSYTQAAHLLHKTQSTVSLQVRRLERTLGVELFEHPRSQVVLSSHGQSFIEYARRMIELNREALASVEHGVLKGVLRIGSNNFYASRILPRVLVEFCARYPGVQVELTTGGQAELSAGLGPRFDLILNFYRADRFEGLVLSHEPLHWVQAADRDVWDRDPLPVAALPRENLLRTIMLDCLEGLDRPWRLIYESESVDANMAAVEAGLAVSVCVESRLRDSSPSLRDVADRSCPPLPECVFTVELAPRVLSRETSVFHDYLVDTLLSCD